MVAPSPFLECVSLAAADRLREGLCEPTGEMMDRLLEHAPSWSLAEDAALLAALAALADSLGAQTRQLQVRMDRLATGAASAHTRLLTTHNNFMQLANTKFIEARVYDDSDDVETKEAETDGTKDEPSDESITAEALKAGVRLLETAFEKVEIEDSDSEEESAKMISVMQPKNPFHVRSLPAIIGSQAWMEDDKIGLVEEEAEEAEEDLSDSSDDEKPVENVGNGGSDYSDSDEGVGVGVKPEATPPPKIAPDELSEFSDDDELFKPVPSAKPGTPPPGPDPPSIEGETVETKKVFSSELAQKLGHPRERADHADSSSGEEAEVEELRAEVARTKTLTKTAPPAKKSLLFDSSDSDDDLFSPKPALPKQAAKPKTPDVPKATDTPDSKKLPPPPPPSAKPVAATLPAKVDEASSPPLTPPTAAATPPRPAARKPLFGSSSEDDDDIFADIKVKPVVAPKSGLKEVEDSEDSDDIFSIKAPKSPNKDSKVEDEESSGAGPKKPFGGISMFGTGFNPVSVLKGDKSATEDEEEDIFAPKVTTSAPLAADTPEPNTQVDKPATPDKDVNIFAPTSKLREERTDSEDDIFASSPKLPQPPPAASKPPANRETLSGDSPTGDPVFKDPAPGPPPVQSTAAMAAPSAATSGPPASAPAPALLSSVLDKNHGAYADDVSPDSLALAPAPAYTPVDVLDGGGLLPAGEAELLATVTKARARGTSGRRPPSRAARRGAAMAALVPATADVGRETGDTLPGGESSPVEAEAPAAKKPFGGISMFGTGFNPASALKHRQVGSPDATNKEHDTVPEEATLGDGGIVEEATESVPDEQNIPVDEDEFVKAEPPEMPSENEEKYEDDIFGSKIPALNDEAKSSMLVESEDDDDMFANITKQSKPTGVPLASGSESSKTTKNIFGFDDSDDDDDLFSNMASGVRPALRPDPMANILGDDSDEDLFSSLMSKSSK